MKTNHKFLLSLLLTLGLGTSGLFAQAADMPPPPPGGETRHDGPRGHPPFELSARQKTQLDAIRQTAATAVKAVRDDSTLTPEQKKVKIGDLMKASRESYRALLTPEQQAKVDAFRKDHPRMAKSALLKADVASRLGLTTEQVEKIRAIESSTRDQIKAVLTPKQQKQMDQMKNQFRHRLPDGRPMRGPGAQPGPRDFQAMLGLTDAQKAQAAEIHKATVDQIKMIRDDSTLSREDKKTKITELQKAGMEKFKALLTPEQQQKISDMKSHRKAPPAPDGDVDHGEAR